MIACMCGGLIEFVVIPGVIMLFGSAVGNRIAKRLNAKCKHKCGCKPTTSSIKE